MNTAQEEFDAVVAHLYKQGRPAKNVDGSCVYRNASGLMCAVGCRIPESAYNSAMENNTVDVIVGNFGNVLPKEITAYEEMFSSLQDVHDICELDYADNFDLLALGHHLNYVAQKFGLTFTPPQQGE